MGKLQFSCRTTSLTRAKEGKPSWACTPPCFQMSLACRSCSNHLLVGTCCSNHPHLLQLEWRALLLWTDSPPCDNKVWHIFFLHTFSFSLPFKQPFGFSDMFLSSFLPTCGLMLFPLFYHSKLAVDLYSRERKHPLVINILWWYMNVITITLKITVFCGSSLSGKQSACLHSKTRLQVVVPQTCHTGLQSAFIC